MSDSDSDSGSELGFARVDKNTDQPGLGAGGGANTRGPPLASENRFSLNVFRSHGLTPRLGAYKKGNTVKFAEANQRMHNASTVVSTLGAAFGTCSSAVSLKYDGVNAPKLSVDSGCPLTLLALVKRLNERGAKNESVLQVMMNEVIINLQSRREHPKLFGLEDLIHDYLVYQKEAYSEAFLHSLFAETRRKYAPYYNVAMGDTERHLTEIRGMSNKELRRDAYIVRARSLVYHRMGYDPILDMALMGPQGRLSTENQDWDPAKEIEGKKGVTRFERLFCREVTAYDVSDNQMFDGSRTDGLGVITREQIAKGKRERAPQPQWVLEKLDSLAGKWNTNTISPHIYHCSHSSPSNPPPSGNVCDVCAMPTHYRWRR